MNEKIAFIYDVDLQRVLIRISSLSIDWATLLRMETPLPICLCVRAKLKLLINESLSLAWTPPNSKWKLGSFPYGMRPIRLLNFLLTVKHTPCLAVKHAGLHLAFRYYCKDSLEVTRTSFYQNLVKRFNIYKGLLGSLSYPLDIRFMPRPLISLMYILK